MRRERRRRGRRRRKQGKEEGDDDRRRPNRRIRATTVCLDAFQPTRYTVVALNRRNQSECSHL